MIYIKPIEDNVLSKYVLIGDPYELQIFTPVTLFSSYDIRSFVFLSWKI